MASLPMVENNEDADVCGKCEGACCKVLPGCYHPSQFGPSLEGVEELLRAGKAAIDWWEGELAGYEGTSYYLRPATKSARRHPFDPSWGGECILLTPAGCPLSFEDRPLGCRMLKPDPNWNGQEITCQFEGIGDLDTEKEFAAIAWQPFAKRLEAIGRMVESQQ